MKVKSIYLKKAALFFMVLMCFSWVLSGQEDRGQNKDMGYCFDAAYHQEQKRLYVVGGSKGLHVFNVSEGHLEFVTTVYDEGYYRNIDISQERAFIADASRGLIVIDISGENPVVTWMWKPKLPAWGFMLMILGPI